MFLLMRMALHPLGKKLTCAITSAIVAEAKALVVQTLEEYQQQLYMGRREDLARYGLTAILDHTLIATFKGLEIVFHNYSANPQEPHPQEGADSARRVSIRGRILHAFISLVKKDAALQASQHYYMLIICPHDFLRCCCLLSKSADGPDILTWLAAAFCLLTEAK
tara:strand:+ start:45 stop:539 length:495 start_codon:yes stop_codon:yes gene_type:complete